MNKKKLNILSVLMVVFVVIIGITVNANKVPTKIEIDSPYSGETVKNALNFDGWLMSEDKNASINLYIDDIKVTPIKLERYEREDVLKAISGYGGKSLNPTPGYRGSIDISSVQDGTHTLRVESVTNTGEILANAYSNFKIKDYEGKIEIDKPTSNGRVKTKLDYQGWVMSDDSNALVEVYIDGVKQANVERYEREDVLKAISGYGGRSTNKKPGYQGSVDVSGLVDGVHTMTVRLVSSTGTIIKEVTSSFPVQKYDTKIEIDSPYNNQSANKSLFFDGWVMSEDKDVSINVYVDNAKVTPSKLERYEREDVLKAISGYGGKSLNPTPGYQGSVDISTLQDGVHAFRVEVVSKTGEILANAYSSFRVNVYEGKIEIDKPTSNGRVKTKLDYQGWVMSEDKDDVVEIYIDGVQQTNVERYAREDVLKAVSGYGGRSTNKKPGYRGSVDVSGLVDGVHTMTVRLVSSTGIVIKEATSSFPIKKYDAKLEIDHPYSNQNANGVLNFDGWVMSEDKDVSINIYVDNTKVTPIKLERYEREDVLKVISGYGGKSLNSTPGYQGSIDISSLQDGVHAYKVEIVSKTGEVLTSSYSSFKLHSYEGKIEIDKPISSERVKTKLNYQGWAMTDDQKATVEIYIDGVQQTNVERYAREDVLKAISGYGGRSTNKTPGYRGSVDVSGLVDGVHTMTVRLVSSTGTVIQERKSSFNIKKYDTKVEIDSPIKSNLNKQNLNFKGWVMSEDKDAIVNIYIDDVKVDSSKIERYEREDVLNAISGYGGAATNKKPGYRGTVPYQEITEGNHIFKIEVLASKTNEVLNVQTNSFYLKRYDTKIEIDSPLSIHTKKTSIDIQGWIMSEDAKGILELYIDGNKIDSSKIERYEREDVLNAISGYGGATTNKTPGFRATVDSSSMKDGNHTFEVWYISSESPDVIKKVSSKFTIKKYDGRLELDSPISSNFNESVKVIGWEMSELDNSYVKVYIDNTDVSASFSRVEREDVLNAITEYGGRTTNEKPGYEGTINLSSIAEGNHKIKIRLYTRLDELISQTEKNIFVYKNKHYGVDVSSYNTISSWQTVKNNGFDYAMIRAGVRGYGVNNIGIDGFLREDEKFLTNVKGATDVGIKVGAYVYSQAVNEIEAVQEANLAIRMVNNAGGKSKVTLPIVFDSEYSGCKENGVRCGRADRLSREDRTTIAIAFLETVRNAGYTPMVYASTSFLNDQLNMARLSNYEVWVAHYGVSVPTYKGIYQMWQYTSTGYVPGIVGNVDVNEVYKNY